MTIRIIAEAGVNHNGELSRAYDLIAAAADAGADMVKFQTFSSEQLASNAIGLARYQVDAGVTANSQVDMLRALELSRSDHEFLIEECQKHNIGFLSSAFDHQSLALLSDDFHQGIVKFGSGELTNAPLLFDAARRQMEILLSTGMSTLDEIGLALRAISAGFELPAGSASSRQMPDADAMTSKWDETELYDNIQGRVTLLHCVSSYPAADETLNLRAMKTMRDQFGLEVGYSDHSLGITAGLAAAACGASCIEKHITLDRRLPGPDHSASIEPTEFKQLVDGIRTVERMLGDGEKKPTAAESDTARVARKTIVAAQPIAKGEAFATANITIKRAGQGLRPNYYWTLLGKPAPRDFIADEIIDL